ncbi:hypothetical protein FGO68_gene2022 [Halteria grandinella]|uniref:Uncharacterized protein n=1 Tax=Halteria grandinella TaxID=5974 RepID=A0A8J8T244_HALGN|nr:hypothetical protein FGO68_gene2022 [Halteria grandinella]
MVLNPMCRQLIVSVVGFLALIAAERSILIVPSFVVYQIGPVVKSFIAAFMVALVKQDRLHNLLPSLWNYHSMMLVHVRSQALYSIKSPWILTCRRQVPTPQIRQIWVLQLQSTLNHSKSLRFPEVLLIQMRIVVALA